MIEENEKDDIVQMFIDCIKYDINYWHNMTDRTEKEKMEGLAFSILCLLDGVCCDFPYSIDDLQQVCANLMLHDCLHEVKNGN